MGNKLTPESNTALSDKFIRYGQFSEQSKPADRKEFDMNVLANSKNLSTESIWKDENLWQLRARVNNGSLGISDDTRNKLLDLIRTGQVELYLVKETSKGAKGKEVQNLFAVKKDSSHS